MTIQQEPWVFTGYRKPESNDQIFKAAPLYSRYLQISEQETVQTLVKLADTNRPADWVCV